MVFDYLGLSFMGFVHFDCFYWFVRSFPQKIEGVREKESEKFYFLCFLFRLHALFGF
jgi:hypothetical protein